MIRITSTFSLFVFLLFSVNSFAQNSLPSQSLKTNTQQTALNPYKDPKTGLYGFKNANDKVIIACKYAFVYPFSEGLAAVNLGGKVGFDAEYTNDYFVNGGKWGYINETGKLIIPTKYEAAEFFYDGFAIVELNGKKAFITKSGKQITAFEYDMMNPYSEGLAAVGKGEPMFFSYIDTTGTVIITGDYSAAGNFLKGKARVTRYGALYFINKKGERIK